MTIGFEVQGDRLEEVAAALRESADLAAQVNSRLRQLGRPLDRSECGERLVTVLDELSSECCTGIGQVVTGFARLADWVAVAAVGYRAADRNAGAMIGRHR